MGFHDFFTFWSQFTKRNRVKFVAAIETINTIFSPSEEEIERARRVMEAYEEAREKGLGAVSVDGRMVDNATVRLARVLWEQARTLGMA